MGKYSVNGILSVSCTDPNLAMFDGAELGTHIVANPGDLEGALIAYEKDLFTKGTWASST